MNLVCEHIYHNNDWMEYLHICMKIISQWIQGHTSKGFDYCSNKRLEYFDKLPG